MTETEKQREIKGSVHQVQKKQDKAAGIRKQGVDYREVAETNGFAADPQGPDYFTIDQFSFMTGKDIL